MAKASNPPLDHVQSCSVLRVKGIDASECLLDVLHAHGDVPPVQNALGGLADRGADKTGKCCFTIAKDRDPRDPVAIPDHEGPGAVSPAEIPRP